MNKTAILQTAVRKLEDNIYVFESPLLPDCIGAADNEEEAWGHFIHHVETAYAAYLEGRLFGMYDSPGRPPKNRVSLTVRVQPSTKDAIAKLAEAKACSQGEITDYLLAFWESQNATKSKITKRSSAGKRNSPKQTLRTKRRA